MKRFMKLMSVVFVLGAVAMASNFGGNPEVVVKGSGGNHCDSLERLLGACRNTENILLES